MIPKLLNHFFFDCSCLLKGNPQKIELNNLILYQVTILKMCKNSQLLLNVIFKSNLA